MKRILFFILLITGITVLSADVLSKSIGMSAGYISGSGFSYRVMDGKIGYQIAGGLLYSKHEEELYYSDEKYDEIYNGSNISATFYYNLINKETSRFYLLAGTTFFRVYEKYEDYDYYYNAEIVESTNSYFNIGVGIGLEFPLTKHLHTSIDWPWYYDNKANFLKFIPQAGLHYYF
jgi:hypothetical protein